MQSLSEKGTSSPQVERVPPPVSGLNETTTRADLLSGILSELQRQNEFIERLLLVEQHEHAEQDAEYGSSFVMQPRRQSEHGGSTHSGEELGGGHVV